MNRRAFLQTTGSTAAGVIMPVSNPASAVFEIAHVGTAFSTAARWVDPLIEKLNKLDDLISSCHENGGFPPIGFHEICRDYFAIEENQQVKSTSKQIVKEIGTSLWSGFKRMALFHDGADIIRQKHPEISSFLKDNNLFGCIDRGKNGRYYIRDHDKYEQYCEMLGLTHNACDAFLLQQKLDLEWGSFDINIDKTPSATVFQLCDQASNLKQKFQKHLWPEGTDASNHHAYLEICEAIDEKIASWLPGFIKQFFPQVWEEMLQGKHSKIREKLKDKSGHIHDDQLRRADYCAAAWAQIHKGNDYY